MPDNHNNNDSHTSAAPKVVVQNNSNHLNAVSSGWVTVNTSDSVEAQRMNIMKGNDNEFFVKLRK